MAIVRWDPFRDLISIQERMNKLFDETLSRSRGEEAAIASTWAPAVDIYETSEHIVMKAELPGLTRDDIDIQLQNNILTLRGERKFEKDVKQESYLRVERSYGPFQRTFSLPAEIQQDEIRATFSDGVLELVLPKAERARPKQIKIEVA
jgi:HSP20 family protein